MTTRTPRPTPRRATAGFSLSEQLVAIMIMLLVSIVMANGIPAAASAYKAALDASNAQLLLATTVTRLRDELGMADPSQVTTDATSGKLQYFISSETGMKVTLTAEDGAVSVTRQAIDPYNGQPFKDASGKEIEGMTEKLLPTAAGKGAKDLAINLGDITYNDGIFTIASLSITRDSKVVGSAKLQAPLKIKTVNAS